MWLNNSSTTSPNYRFVIFTADAINTVCLPPKSSSQNVITYPGVAWQILDLIIEFIGQLVTKVHKSLSNTLSSSDCTLHRNYSNFKLDWTELNCQLLLTYIYIASGRTTAQKTYPLLSNGYMRTRIENTCYDTSSIVVCVYSRRCLEIGLLFTI
jgi:hypothetical protein